MRAIPPHSPSRVPWRLLTVSVILAAGIVTTGYLYYHHYEQRYCAEVERQLFAIAELKAHELADWREERLGDAHIFFKNAAFSALVRRFFDAPQDVDVREQIRSWLGKVQAAYQYDRVFLLDARYARKMMVPEGPEQGTSYVSDRSSEILRSGEIAFEDFYRNAQNQRIYLKVLVPIFEGGIGSRLAAVVALRMDPATYLYPGLGRWPIPSRTAETLLVRRDGNDALFLNNLRFQKDAALNLHFSLKGNEELPAVKAAMGQEGIVEGVDYRGEPVIAAVRAVPDSPWFLVARMDTAEAYAPLREHLWLTAVLVGTMLLAAGATVGLVWRQQGVRFYRERSRVAEALRESEENLSITLHSIGDAVIATDTDGRVVRMNPVAERLTGWPLAEAVGKPLAEIFRIINARTREPVSDPLAKALATGEVVVLTNDTTLIARDGAERQIADSAAPIHNAQGRIRGAVLVFHDVTAEYEVKKALRERVKELACLQQVRGGLQAGLSVEQLCQNTAEYLVQGVGYPEIAVAVITFGDQQFSSGRSAEGLTHGLHAEIEVAGGAHGRVSVFYTENKSFLLPDEQNLVNAVATILSHWLESKRAAEELARERKNMKAIFEGSPVGLLLMDENTVVTAVNDVASKLVRKPSAEMINRQPGEALSCIHASDDARGCGHGPCCSSCPIRATIESVFRSGQPVRAAEVQPVLSIGGSNISPWLEIGAKLVMVDGKRHVIASVTNITDRKRAEEERRRLAAILEATPDFVGFADAKDTHILYINKAGRLLTGLTPEEDVTRLKISDVHPEWANRMLVETVLPTALRDGVWTGECAFLHRDGHEIPVLMALVAHKTSSGEVECFSTISRDITDRKRMEGELRHLAVIVEQAAEGIAVVDLEGNLQFVNDAWARMHGYESGAELVGKHLRVFHTDEQLKTDVIPFNEVVIQRGHNVGEMGHVRKDGTTFPSRMMVTLLKDERGEPYGLAAVVQDITDRKRAEEAIRRSEQRFQEVARTAEEWIWEVDAQGLYTYSSHAIESILGYTPEEAVGRKYFYDFFRSEDREAAKRAAFEVFARKGVFRGFANRAVHKNGKPIWLMTTAAPMLDAGGNLLGYRGTDMDVTERRAAEEALRQANSKLEELATTDELTGLANRRRFLETLQAEVERARRRGSPLALVMFDVDGFKAINDTHGHVFGDRVLIELAKTLRGGARACDIAARYGGDEFMILMPETRVEEAVNAVERMRKAFAHRTISDGRRSLQVTVSAGVSGLQTDGVTTADALVRLADEALYAAKHSGRDRVLAWSQIRHDQAEETLVATDQVETLRREVAKLGLQSKEVFVEGLWSLVRALEARDPYSRGHSENVTRYAVAIAETLGLEAEEIAVIRRAAMVYDIGKIGVPDGILRKRGALADHERRIMQRHVLVSVEILGEMRFLEREVAIVRHHHERWDGKGYPDGIAASAIPRGARILAAADAFDAITSDRVYRVARSLPEALQVLLEESGRQFDPEVVDALVQWVLATGRQVEREENLTIGDLLKAPASAAKV